MDTSNTVANTTRLSIEGSESPHCHLYTAWGDSNPKTSWISLTDSFFCLRSDSMFLPVAFMLILGNVFANCVHLSSISANQSPHIF